MSISLWLTPPGNWLVHVHLTLAQIHQAIKFVICARSISCVICVAFASLGQWGFFACPQKHVLGQVVFQFKSEGLCVCETVCVQSCKEYAGCLWQLWYSPPWVCELRIVGVLLLCRYCVDTVNILCRYCVDTVSILCRYCVDTVSILCRYCVDTVSILCRYCVDTMSILCRYCVDTV